MTLVTKQSTPVFFPESEAKVRMYSAISPLLILHLSDMSEIWALHEAWRWIPLLFVPSLRCIRLKGFGTSLTIDVSLRSIMMLCRSSINPAIRICRTALFSSTARSSIRTESIYTPTLRVDQRLYFHQSINMGISQDQTEQSTSFASTKIFLDLIRARRSVYDINDNVFKATNEQISTIVKEALNTCPSPWNISSSCCLVCPCCSSIPY